MSQQLRISGVATKIFHPVDAYTNDTCTQYHDTVVVRFNQYSIILNSDGWRTATTKTRMNQTSNQFNLGFRVFQSDGEWLVSYRGKEYIFNDGMILSRKNQTA